MQPDTGQRGGEQVVARQCPQHRAAQTGQRAGGEQRGGGGVLGVRAGAGGLVQRADGEAAVWQMAVEGGDAEADRGRAAAGRVAGDAGDPGAEVGQDVGCDGGHGGAWERTYGERAGWKRGFLSWIVSWGETPSDSKQLK
jgi:hypothetical protein